jgi:sulfur-oxidizing protein SoxY
MIESAHRRLFLKKSVATCAIGLAVSTGLLTPAFVMASRPVDGFAAKNVPDAFKGLFGVNEGTETDKITITSPEVAENGSSVPVTIVADLANIETIALIAANNASPLTSSIDLQPGVKGFYSSRIKVGKSADLIAVVKADGKVYSARKPIKVTVGGC